MASILEYTVQAGDSFWQIAANLNACSGVSAAQLEAANPGIPATALQVGQTIAVPSPASSEVVLHYVVQPGDSYWQIATNLNACAGVTAQDIEDANPGVSSTGLSVGQVIHIPAGGKPEPVPAPNIGYWRREWVSSCTPPGGATLGIAFSGLTDPTTALSRCAPVVGGLVGTRYLALGGGTDDGRFTARDLDNIATAITGGQLSAYEGIAYDIEGGDSGLASAFGQSFATAKAAGLMVLVTVSHTAPCSIADADTLMRAFFPDGNIDFLSPQLYTGGKETANDWAITSGSAITWDQYAAARAAIIPSIVSASLYPEAQSTFATAYGVTTQGYVVWSC
jgi:LysM repeat protein